VTHKYAITRYTGTDRHEQGCKCGHCEPLTGRCSGVGIFAAEGTDDESVENAVLSDDPVERVFASSPNAAREAAKARLIELGYEFLGDI
jgi:hypothetical protein